MLHVFTPSVGFLSSRRMLDIYLSGRFPSDTDIELELFLTQREIITYLPNQIHDNNRQFSNYYNYSLSTIFNKSVERLSTMLECSGNKMSVQSNYHCAWQSMLLNVSSIPIIAWKIVNESSCNSVVTNMGFSSFPFFKNDLLEKEKFKDLHVHINGASEVTYNWLYCLQNLKIVYIVVKKSYEKTMIQYKQLGINSSGALYKLIKKAKFVREFFLDFMDRDMDYILTIEFTKKWKAYFCNDLYDTSPYIKNIDFKNPKKEYTLQYELLMWCEIFKKINNEVYSDDQKNILYALMHFYILVMSLFNKFLVQQFNQYGFSQFQLIADNELRDMYEDKGYKDRYLQLKGFNNDENLWHLELRFAPKDTVKKTIKIYQKIIKDYDNLKKNKKIDFDIAIVAHFIKQKDNIRKSELSLECRWAYARAKLEQQRQALLSALDGSKREEPFVDSTEDIDFFGKFVGLDAAGNELYTRPEVFAPTFNYLNKEFKDRFGKHLNVTFHAGEDYTHLLCGIRYVWEAIIFLGMDIKDNWTLCRIGHATALGIDPKFWADKLSNVLVMPCGDYLDNMILTKELLKINDYDNEIELAWGEIYKSDYNHKKAWEAYMLRKEDPYRCSNLIVQQYNSYDVVQNYNKLIEVKIEPKDIYIMCRLQQKVLELMKEKNIAIESMITSNVRISYYDKYEDHHIHRWLFPEEEEKDIMPPVVLASDDPGLFNNNIRIEFSHLYEILKKKGKKEDEIKKAIEELQNNAKKYMFKNVIKI